MDLIETLHNSLIFYPTREVNSSPTQDGVSYEDIFIDTEDGEKLHGYFFPAKVHTPYIMLYLHGNGENVTSWYTACIEIQKHINVNALLVDYRGYGQSTGKPTVEGVIKDAHAMYQCLINKGYQSKHISVYGRSLGGALAVELGVKEKIKSLVVQSSFTSLKDVAKDLYPFIPNALVKGDYWNSLESIKKITVPSLISHGDKDEVISVKHSHKLYEAANKPKKLIILKGAMHNDLSSFFNEEYFSTLKEMLL